jgi:hypothetical protein
MHRISAGLAACLVAAVTVGCGSVQAAPSAHPAQRPSCQSRSPNITQADNGKTFCARVGDTVSVLLHSSRSSPWLPPLASSGALQPAPNGAGALAVGVTAGWFTAVRPGRVLVTSVRPPCQVAISAGKAGLEPADPVPTSYPLRFCPPGQRLSVSVVVTS